MTLGRMISIVLLATLEYGCALGKSPAPSFWVGSPKYPTFFSSKCGEPVRVNETSSVVYIVMGRACTTPFLLQIVAKGGESLVAVDRFGYEWHQAWNTSTKKVIVVQQGQWRRAEFPESFKRRDGAGLLELGGYLFILGGWTYDEPYNGEAATVSEVWRSSDATTWELLGNAPWPGRHGAGWVVHNDKMFVVSGDLFSDIWSSSDGLSWNRDGETQPFGGRYTPNVASFNGYLYLYGGMTWTPGNCPSPKVCNAVGFDDTWKSLDGRNWIKVGDAPWQGRALVHGSAVSRGKLFVIGGGLKASVNQPTGQTVKEFYDVWSTVDGVNWVRETEDFGIPPRTHFSVLGTNEGCYLSDGSVGTQANVSSDVFFAEDCAHFALIPDKSPMQGRHASSMIMFNGSLLIFGGPPTDHPGRDIWQYFP